MHICEVELAKSSHRSRIRAQGVVYSNPMPASLRFARRGPKQSPTVPCADERASQSQARVALLGRHSGQGSFITPFWLHDGIDFHRGPAETLSAGGAALRCQRLGRRHRIQAAFESCLPTGAEHKYIRLSHDHTLDLTSRISQEQPQHSHNRQSPLPATINNHNDYPLPVALHKA